ncbi:GNAT family N-acetyltransferase [Chitinophaga nivalis]|uniref:Acetyltransferase n=1 Tax=Chitinophaga nivalis TaxID=2991709 RepID=A0ABT3IKP7_9BACT|nr:GNAT family N-acetyltransferase [Chitinophaga nivalis]MCW3465767.1 acetyltransferase [Chitinophaga nivalis]MCW3484542.1 acetyltransferase [Chitinophaga nivalis]
MPHDFLTHSHVLPSLLNPEAHAFFKKEIPALGTFVMQPLQCPADIPVIHHWLNQDYAAFWQLQQTSAETINNIYTEMIGSSHTHPYLGRLHDQPAFLVEFYDASKDRIGEYYDVQPGDFGFHILMSPPVQPIKNFTWHVFTMIIEVLFSYPTVKRLIVEPDTRNEKIHVLNKRAGFVYQHEIKLPEKTAHLAFLTREAYQHALAAASFVS